MIVPGVAVPAGTSIYKIFKEQLLSLDILLQNFYIIKTGDFFVILLIQQIAFGFLASLLQSGKLYTFWFSPTIVSAVYDQPDNEYTYFKDEGNIFDYGFSYAQVITILGIIFIYSLTNKHPCSVCNCFRSHLLRVQALR